MADVKRVIILTAVFLASFTAFAQQPVIPKAPYDSTKAQLSVTKEENLQLKATAAQTAYQQAMKDMQAQWQAEEASLTAWIAEVKKVNGWDETYTYDRAKDQWTHTPKVEAKKPAEAPRK
jgi:hypothetical protein